MHCGKRCGAIESEERKARAFQQLAQIQGVLVAGRASGVRTSFFRSHLAISFCSDQRHLRASSAASSVTSTATTMALSMGVVRQHKYSSPMWIAHTPIFDNCTSC